MRDWYDYEDPPMRDEGDMLAGPRVYTPFGCAWRVALAVLIIYGVMVAFMLEFRHA